MGRGFGWRGDTTEANSSESAWTMSPRSSATAKLTFSAYWSWSSHSVVETSFTVGTLLLVVVVACVI
jgi:hypothetical protein